MGELNNLLGGGGGGVVLKSLVKLRVLYINLEPSFIHVIMQFLFSMVNISST